MKREEERGEGEREGEREGREREKEEEEEDGLFSTATARHITSKRQTQEPNVTNVI